MVEKDIWGIGMDLWLLETQGITYVSLWFIYLKRKSYGMMQVLASIKTLVFLLHLLLPKLNEL